MPNTNETMWALGLFLTRGGFECHWNCAKLKVVSHSFNHHITISVGECVTVQDWVSRGFDDHAIGDPVCLDLCDPKFFERLEESLCEVGAMRRRLG